MDPPRPAQSWLPLEALTSQHQLPHGLTSPEEPRGCGVVPTHAPGNRRGPHAPRIRPPPQGPRPFGIGSDTSPYGPSATWLRDGRPPAAAALEPSSRGTEKRSG